MAMIILFFVFIYFIPTLVGIHNKNLMAIFIINLFFGWTLIGWVAALVIAVYKKVD